MTSADPNLRLRAVPRAPLSDAERRMGVDTQELSKIIDDVITCMDVVVSGRPLARQKHVQE
jgi:hypothetical protein